MEGKAILEMFRNVYKQPASKVRVCVSEHFKLVLFRAKSQSSSPWFGGPLLGIYLQTTVAV